MCVVERVLFVFQFNTSLPALFPLYFPQASVIFVAANLLCFTVIDSATMNSVLLTLYTIDYMVYIVHHTLYTVHCTLYTVHCRLYTVHCTVHCTAINILLWPGSKAAAAATALSFCWTALYCTALHWIVLQCTVLHCTALYCTALHCIALHCTVLFCTALYCTALHCIALHYTGIYCVTLHCIALTCNMLHCIWLHSSALNCTVLLCSASWGSPWCSLTPFRFGRDQTRQLSLKWLPGERPKTAESCHNRPWLNPSIAAWPHHSKLDEGQQTQSAASTGQPRNGESYSIEIFQVWGF